MYLLLACSVLLATAKSSVYNFYAKRAKPDTEGVFRFNALAYGVAMLLALVFALAGGSFTLSLSTLLCAALYGLTVVALQTLSILAMRQGPMSLTTLIVAYGMIIPAVAGPIFWHEDFGGLQIVGLVLILLSLWMIRDKDTAARGVTVKWTLLLLLCFLLSGMAGLWEKIHQSTDGKDERAAFVLVGCAVMLCVSLAAALVCRQVGGKATAAKASPLSPSLLLVPGLATGLTVGLYSIVNLTLAGGLNTLIYYPVANGGFLLLAMLVSFLFFRERLTWLKGIGFGVGLAAIVLLSLPI